MSLIYRPNKSSLTDGPKENENALLIVDWNCQNAVLTDAQLSFSKKFPKTYQSILLGLHKKNLYNKAINFSENGVKGYILFAQESPVGGEESADEISDTVEGLMEAIVAKTNFKAFYSTLLYSDSGAWKKINKIINKNKYEWRLYANAN